jgi:hypothetical protein
LKDALDGHFAALEIRVNPCGLSLGAPLHPGGIIDGRFDGRRWRRVPISDGCAQSATALLQPVLQIRSDPTHLLPR